MFYFYWIIFFSTKISTNQIFKYFRTLDLRVLTKAFFLWSCSPGCSLMKHWPPSSSTKKPARRSWCLCWLSDRPWARTTLFFWARTVDMSSGSSKGPAGHPRTHPLKRRGSLAVHITRTSQMAIILSFPRCSGRETASQQNGWWYWWAEIVLVTSQLETQTGLYDNLPLVHPCKQEDTNIRPQVSVVNVSPVLDGALAMEVCVVHIGFQDDVGEI